MVTLFTQNSPMLHAVIVTLFTQQLPILYAVIVTLFTAHFIIFIHTSSCNSTFFAHHHHHNKTYSFYSHGNQKNLRKVEKAEDLSIWIAKSRVKNNATTSPTNFKE